jgi:uncharacterized protein DUF6907
MNNGTEQAQANTVPNPTPQCPPWCVTDHDGDVCWDGGPGAFTVHYSQPEQPATEPLCGYDQSHPAEVRVSVLEEQDGATEAASVDVYELHDRHLAPADARRVALAILAAADMAEKVNGLRSVA